MFRCFLTIALSALGALASGLPSNRLIMVDDDTRQCRNARYRTVVEAVQAAVPGDEIVLCAGSYTVPLGGLLLDKAGLKLKAAGALGAVRIRPARGAEDRTGPGLVIAADGVEVRGLDIGYFRAPAITSRGGRPVAGIWIEGNRVHHSESGLFLSGVAGTVLGNTAVRNRRQGIIVERPAGIVELRENRSADNSQEPGFTAGIEIRDAARGVLVTGNDCVGNAVGMRLERSWGTVVEGNRLSGNRLGMDLVASSRNRITTNKLNNNAGVGGLWARKGSLENVIRDNEALDNSYDGMFIFADSRQNTLQTNRLQGNGHHGLHFGTMQDSVKVAVAQR